MDKIIKEKAKQGRIEKLRKKRKTKQVILKQNPNNTCYRIAADFETTITDLNERKVRVYRWCAYNFEIKEKEFGSDIQSFIEYIHKYPRADIWFHNSKFDASYILDYLIKNGAIHNDRMKENHYEYVIGDIANFTYYWGKNKYCNIKDSYELIQSSLEKLGETVGLEKGDTKENAFYTNEEIENELTRQEKKNLDKYLERDIDILVKVIEDFKLFNLNEMATTKAQLAYKGLTTNELISDKYTIKPNHKLTDIKDKHITKKINDWFIYVENKQNKKYEYFLLNDWDNFNENKKRNYKELFKEKEEKEYKIINPIYVKMNEYKNSMDSVIIPLKEYEFYIPRIQYKRFTKTKTLPIKEQKKLLDLINKISLSSYKGGINYVNPKYQNQWITKRIYQYDINSMYPWIYSSLPMPDSLTIKKTNFLGNNDLGLIILNKLDAKCKDDKFPLLKLKTDTLVNNEYGKLSKNGGNIDEYYYDFYYDDRFSLTNVEYQYLLKNYDIKDIEVKAMYKFDRNYILEIGFSDYCKYWYNEKKIARDKDDGVRAYFAKLMLNSLYGKFGQYDKWFTHYKYNTNNGFLEKIEIPGSDNGSLKSADVLVASYITAYGRIYLANAINNIGLDNFIYCDTDSIHSYLKPEEIESKINIFNIEKDFDTFTKILNIKGVSIGKELGQFKFEGHSDLSKYIQNKTYGHEFKELKNGKWKKKEWKTICAGFTDQIEKENFEKGLKVDVKRSYLVNGGYAIIEKPIEIGAKIQEIA